MRWRIASIAMEGFRSFKELTTISFPSEESCAILIRGAYSDSTVSSGSGKSSVVMAAAYGLGFTAPPATELKSWGEKKMFVELKLTDGERNLYVRRSPKLRVTLDGQVWEGASAEVELDKILSLNRSLAEVLTYRAQRKPGSFLSKTDSEKKEFLSTILGLGEIEVASERAAASLAELKSSKQSLEQAVAIIMPTLQVPARLDQLVAEAEVAYKDAEQQLALVNSAAGAIPRLKETEQQLQAELRKIFDVKMKVSAVQSESRQLQLQYKAATDELDSAAQSKCPTCRQEWHAGHDSLHSMKERIEKISERFRSNASFEKASSEVLGQEKYLNEKLEEVRGAIAAATAPSSSASALVRSSAALLNERIAARNSNLEQGRKVIDIRKKLGDVASKIAIDEHVAAILSKDGFLSVIFDEILSEVQDRANDMMSKIPNIGRFSLIIDSVSATKSGSIRKTISTKLMVGSTGEEVSLVTLSGGQRCAVDLCLDLAVSETVRSRTGCPLGWIVLDEAMDGLDNSTKQDALAMILSVVKGQVIVIDHSTEVQEGFSQIVNVSFDGKWSTVA